MPTLAARLSCEKMRQWDEHRQLTELGLDVGECNHRTIGTSSLVRVKGEADSIVESNADERVHVLLADSEEAMAVSARAWEEQVQRTHISSMKRSRTCGRKYN